MNAAVVELDVGEVLTCKNGVVYDQKYSWSTRWKEGRLWRSGRIWMGCYYIRRWD
jgi:hypothetical protein